MELGALGDDASRGLSVGQSVHESALGAWRGVESVDSLRDSRVTMTRDDLPRTVLASDHTIYILVRTISLHTTHVCLGVS